MKCKLTGIAAISVNTEAVMYSPNISFGIVAHVKYDSSRNITISGMVDEQGSLI